MAETKVSSKEQEIVLFYNASGALGNITLSETSANFSYIEVLYVSNTGLYDSVRVYLPNGKNVSLSTMDDNSTNSNGVIFCKMTTYSISGTAMNILYYGWKQITGAAATGADNTIKVVRVIGIR